MSDLERPTPSATIRSRITAAGIDRWESMEAYTEHVSAVAEACRTKCALGVGKCSMRVTLDSFEIDERERTAVVSSSCEAEDCPDHKAVFDAVFDVARGADTMGHVSRYGHKA